MKIKKVLMSVIVAIVPFSLYSNSTITPAQLSSKTLHGVTSLPSMNSSLSHDMIVERFNASIARFIESRYNDPGYAEYPSQNAEDFVRLLSITKNTKGLGEDQIAYAYTILKLMCEKMKAWNCTLIDDTVVHHVISSLPSMLSPYLSNDTIPELEEIKKIGEHQITSLCNSIQIIEPHSQLISLQKLPAFFLDHCHQFQQAAATHIESRAKLRSIVLRCIETMMSKVTWSQSSYESIWNSVITLSHDIQKLYDAHILDDEDDRDSAWWSLLHGFCKYLDLIGPYLPISFYNEMHSDISHGLVPFLEVEEQDQCISPKKEVLYECLGHVSTKMKAYQRGILTDAPIV